MQCGSQFAVWAPVKLNAKIDGCTVDARFRILFGETYDEQFYFYVD